MKAWGKLRAFLWARKFWREGKMEGKRKGETDCEYNKVKCILVQGKF